MLRNALSLFVIAAIILVLFLPSYAKMQDLKQKNRLYKERIAALEKRNNELTVERERLQDDPVYLEKVAREKMGLIRDGETVYKITH